MTADKVSIGAALLNFSKSDGLGPVEQMLWTSAVAVDNGVHKDLPPELKGLG